MQNQGLPDVLESIYSTQDKDAYDGVNMATKNKKGNFRKSDEFSDVEPDAVPLNSEDCDLSRKMREQLGLNENVSELEDAEKDELKKEDKINFEEPVAEGNSVKFKRCPSKNAANFCDSREEAQGAIGGKVSEGAESGPEGECIGEELTLASYTSNADVAKVRVTKSDQQKGKSHSAVNAQVISKNTEVLKTPISVAVVTPQKQPQTASEVDLSPHTPVEETGTLPKYQLSSSPDQEDTCDETEHFDVLLLHSEHDLHHAAQFNEMAARQEWKVIGPEDFLPKLSKFKAFISAFQRSSYTVLLLTENFRNDVWCENQYQTALVQSIEDPLRRDSVIPVVCEKKFKMPIELSILTGTCPTAPKYENVMKRSIKVGKRLKREQAAALSANQSSLPKSSEKAVTPSMDEIYNSRRPELQPTKYAIRVFFKPQAFRKLCTTLDARHTLDQDWCKVAEMLGCSSKMISSLEQEKSPTAQVLNSVCQQQLDEGVSRKKILEKLRKVLEDMRRSDALEIVNEIIQY